MPTFHLPHFNDIAILRSIEPNRFRDFLLRYENYLSSQAFAIPVTAAFTDDDLKRLMSIFNADNARAPADMIEALFHASELDNDQGMESLLVLASKSGIVLPEGDLTPSDVAMHIWLINPDLLRRANCERIVLRFQSFYYFMNRTMEVPAFELPDDQQLRQIEARMNQFNRSRNRGGGAAVWMYELGDDVAFLIRYGGSLRRDEVMDDDVCRPDVRRPVGYDLVVYNRKYGELRLRAEQVSERKFYCQLFSECLFNDPDFFEYQEAFNLDVLYQLGEDVQSTAMIPGIRKVVLLEAQELLVGKRTLHLKLKSDGIFEALREHRIKLSQNGRMLSAKFRITLDGLGDVTVTICSGNKIRFSRQIGTALIDQWMTHHGIRVSHNATVKFNANSALASCLANPQSLSAKIPLASRTG